MKAHLMYRDGDVDLEANAPPGIAALTQDLGLETVYEAMSGKDPYLHDVARRVVPVSLQDPAAIRYRQQILDDCIAQPQTVRQMYTVAVSAIERERLVMITGANRGGKTTFLRGVGLAQLLMQCGAFVPAERYRAGVCSALFTHFKREEDAAMRSGKLDEELSRMSTIVDRLTAGAMLLLNESFASTNEHDHLI